MKTIKINGAEVTITHVSMLPAGYGHNYIVVYFYADMTDGQESIRFITNDTRSIDAAQELDGDDKYLAFYDIVSDQFEEAITEMIYNSIN